jgi:MFS family permease
MTLGLLVGQWFPTRKGTVMGIATLAFPIANGLLGPFAGSVFGPIGAMSAQHIPFDPNQIIMKAFLPFFIVSIVGWLIGVIFIKDYPEQVGAFRDNDKSMTPRSPKPL